MSERERAERWIKANWPMDLRADGEPWEDDVYCLLALMREERARAWREALNKVAQDFHDSYGAIDCPIGRQEVQAFLDARHVHYPECQSKALREEGGKR